MTDAKAPQSPPERTPLEERLVELIRVKGPITVADYMTDALSHPHDGYYMSQNPIGAAGDFTTAPEVSQIFGELVGLWLLDAWRSMGSPEDFVLAELGPGRGVLMADILRVARLRPAFLKAADLWLVETSGRLRLEQQKRLRACGLKPRWADALDDIPPGPALIVANEFFDCLPVQQFQRVDTGWRERMVTVDDDARLSFGLGSTPPPPEFALPSDADSKPGDVFEVGLAAQDFTRALAERLCAQGGAALVFDYGHVASGFGDTLQAVRGHRFWNPLHSPGLADLTAHVDFAALSDAAFEAGAAVYGPTAQGRFLERLGLALRTELLCKDKAETEQHAIRAGADRIAAPDQMGEIFKTMCVAAPGFREPTGFYDI